MKKWYSLLEVLQFPLKMLFVAIVLMGLGDFFVNPNITPYINVTNETILMLCRFTKYLGSFLISIFPMLLVIKLLSKRYEDSVPAYVGVIAYIVFHIVTMFVASVDLPNYCYSAFMGMQIDSKIALLSASGIRYPLVTGLLSCIIVVVITRICYMSSRRRFTYGVLSFVDNDSWSLITTMFWVIVAAVLFSIGWPYAISFINQIFEMIASDIYNPINMFVYGFVERIMSILGLDVLIRNPFWFGNLGGSWMDAFGKTYLGDVNIWTALTTQNLDTFGYGRFITPYYVINMFAVPGMIWAMFFLHTDKMEKRRYAFFFILATIVSVFTGTLFPLEILLLISAPVLYFMHVFSMSALYAIFTAASVNLGYTFTGTLDTAMPGTLTSLIGFLGNENYSETIMIVLGVGIAYFALYFLMTNLYYKVLAGEFLDINKNDYILDTFIDAIGGVANIRIINSSLNKISVLLYDPTRLDYELLKEIDVFKVTETRAGYNIEFGPNSSIIRKGVVKKWKTYQEELKRKPVEQESQMKVK